MYTVYSVPLVWFCSPAGFCNEHHRQTPNGVNKYRLTHFLPVFFSLLFPPPMTLPPPLLPVRGGARGGAILEGSSSGATSLGCGTHSRPLRTAALLLVEQRACNNQRSQLSHITLYCKYSLSSPCSFLYLRVCITR